MSSDVPLGFGFALAQNQAAMMKYARMSEAEKESVLQRAHAVHSKDEMQQLVASLTQNGLH